MHYSSFVYVALLFVTLPLFTSALNHGPSRRHNSLANRRRADVNIYKRFTNARATFYDVGLGACGKWNQPGDFIVALSACNFGNGFPGPNCFKSITIEFQGKTAQATIMDECMGCPCDGLDFSRGLFSFFQPESVGVFHMDWSYNGPPSPPTTQAPQPSWTPPPPPPPHTTSSSAWVAPSSSWSSKTSSTWSSSTWSSSSAWNTTTKTPSHKSTSTMTSSTSLAVPTGIDENPSAPENLQGLNALVVKLGQYVMQNGS